MGSDSLFGLVGLGVLAVVVAVASRIPADKHPLIHFPSEPVLLPVRSEETDKVELVSLRKLLETRCKSLFQEFKELWWLSKCVSAYYLLLSQHPHIECFQRPSADFILRDRRLLQE